MKSNRNDRTIAEFKKRFQKQFNCELDEKLFLFVIEKELNKKKESYLQILLADKGFGFADLLTLKKALQNGENTRSEEANSKTKSKDAKVTKVPKISAKATTKEESKDLRDASSADEKEKRRLYAKSYYLRKKEKSLQGKPLPAKRFKTSAEQRAYQRSYYQRKKATIKKNPIQATEKESSLQPTLNLVNENNNDLNFRPLFTMKTKLRKAIKAE